VSEAKIRVGMIGGGGNSRKHHIPKLQQQPSVEIVAIANRSVASGQRVADEFGIAHAAPHWREIVDDDDIDAVCIGTWPYLHAPVTIAALEAGKHVLCEARMAMDATQAHAMLDASLENPQLVAQIVPAPHTLGLDRTIMDMIGEGFIGDLVSVDAQVTAGSDFPASDSPLHWRHRRELSGMNVMTMGIWYEAMMRWTGPASTVQAVGQVVVGHRRDDAGHRVPMTIPDHVEVLCRMAQGGQMRMGVSTVLGHAPGTTISLYGTEGTLRISEGEGGLVLAAGRRGSSGLSTVEIAPEKKGGWRVEEEFVNAIRGKEPVTHTDFTTAVRYMEWTEAVTTSMRLGQTVELPLL
jgi:predicted dehydrogenase